MERPDPRELCHERNSRGFRILTHRRFRLQVFGSPVLDDDQTASDINAAARSVEQNFAVVEANIGTEPEFPIRQAMKID
jgi:hypothetical protein